MKYGPNTELKKQTEEKNMARRVRVETLRKGDEVTDPNGNQVRVRKVEASLTNHEGVQKLTVTVEGTQPSVAGDQYYRRVDAYSNQWTKKN